MQLLNSWLGLHVDPKDLTFLQISLRGLIVFIVSLVMVRVGDRRFLAKLSAVDAILGFILASMLARAVNGSASFFPTLGAGFVIVFLHKFIAALASRHAAIGKLVKGSPLLVVKDGTVQSDALRSSHISEPDLLEELRQGGKIESPAEVKTAYLERSGKITVVPKQKG